MDRLGLWDWVALGGIVLAVAMILLPWQEVQSCPLFGECGDWEPRTGWAMVGPASVVATTIAIVALFAIPHPVLRRGLPLVVAVLSLGALLMIYAWFDFAIFAEVRGPLAPFFVAVGAVMVTAVATSVAATRALSGPPEVEPPLQPS